MIEGSAPANRRRHRRCAGQAISAIDNLPFDEAGKGVDHSDQPLDPRIAEAAFKLWGWTPDEKKKNGKKS